MAAERRRARLERGEEIKGLLTGHIEELAAIMGRLIKKAEGEQWRCPQCGGFGPNVSIGLKDAAAVVQLLMTAVKEPDSVTAVIPIQVNVVAGGPVVPYSREQGP